MIFFALALFFLGMALGAVLLKHVFNNKRTPKPVVVMHGVANIGGLLLVIAYMVSGHYSNLLIVCIIILVLAAFGGATMFSFDVDKKRVPKILAIVHPIVAVSGVVVLIVYLVKNFA